MHCFTFILPSKTYIKKYITALHGDPIIITLNTDFGFVVLNTLASRIESKAWRGCIDIWQNRYSDQVTFQIPFHYFSITKKEVSPFTIGLLNRYFENKFEEELYREITKYRSAGNTYKKSIELFLTQYKIDLEIDISYDAIIKAEYRNRKKNQNKFSRDLSTPQNLFTAIAV